MHRGSAPIFQQHRFHRLRPHYRLSGGQPYGAGPFGVHTGNSHGLPRHQNCGQLQDNRDDQGILPHRRSRPLSGSERRRLYRSWRQDTPFLPHSDGPLARNDDDTRRRRPRPVLRRCVRHVRRAQRSRYRPRHGNRCPHLRDVPLLFLHRRQIRKIRGESHPEARRTPAFIHLPHPRSGMEWKNYRSSWTCCPPRRL